MRRKTEFLLCRWLRSHHFILLMEISAFTGFFAGYGISVGTDKVSAMFPYISDTGTTPPASCVFGLFLNMAAAFGVVSIYIRHRQLESNTLDDKIHIVNDVSMFFGLLSCLGMILVACFQWTEVLSVHIVGAFMVFILGSIYCWMQSYLSYTCIGISTTKVKTIIRFVLSFIAVAALVLTCVFSSLANVPESTKTSMKDKLHWNSTDPGYEAHLGSTFSEWIMAISFLLFFLTFYHEFKTLETNVHINCKVTEDLVIEQQQSFRT